MLLLKEFLRLRRLRKLLKDLILHLLKNKSFLTQDEYQKVLTFKCPHLIPFLQSSNKVQILENLQLESYLHHPTNKLMSAQPDNEEQLHNNIQPPSTKASNQSHKKCKLNVDPLLKFLRKTTSAISHLATKCRSKRSSSQFKKTLLKVRETLLRERSLRKRPRKKLPPISSTFKNP